MPNEETELVTANFTLKEARFILKCLQSYPFQMVTVTEMPGIVAQIGKIVRKLAPESETKEPPE